METLREIEIDEQNRRDRAQRYERLTGEVYRHERMITQLEAMTVDLSALKKIHELAADVPEGFTTKGSRFIPGGFIVRTILLDVAGNALADAQAKQNQVRAALSKERTALAKARAAVKAMEETE